MVDPVTQRWQVRSGCLVGNEFVVVIVPGGTVAKGKEKAGRARSRREVLYGEGQAAWERELGPQALGVAARTRPGATASSWNGGLAREQQSRNSSRCSGETTGAMWRSQRLCAARGPSQSKANKDGGMGG